MAIFKKNKKEETKKVSTQEDNELKDEISKAYDEIMSGNKEEKAEEQPQQAPKDDIAFENEVFKSKVKAFKQERNQLDCCIKNAVRQKVFASVSM